MLYLETIQSDTLGLLKCVQALPLLSNTRLVGGTALALQIGHRQSIDLDLFGDWGEGDLKLALEPCGTVVRTGGTGRLQFYELNQVKVDFVTYGYPWLKDSIIDDGLRLAQLEDIAAMKLEAITNRGSKKGFFDIAFLLEIYSLQEMLSLYQEKYLTGLNLLVLRSLVYFDDAEDDPMPIMLKTMTWESAKERIQQAVREYADR
jgi:hypothetical protein